MFYKKGVNISKAKSMFKFLKEHFMYYTLNSWNGLKSIANNVKLYNLELDGDMNKVLDYLYETDCSEINDMISEWEKSHKEYSLGFNGYSGGYLVLYNKENSLNILPDIIIENSNYEDFKKDCKEYYGSIKAYKSELVYYTQLVQDFDKLCDKIRDYVNELSLTTTV